MTIARNVREPSQLRSAVSAVYTVRANSRPVRIYKTGNCRADAYNATTFTSGTRIESFLPLDHLRGHGIYHVHRPDGMGGRVSAAEPVGARSWHFPHAGRSPLRALLRPRDDRRAARWLVVRSLSGQTCLPDFVVAAPRRLRGDGARANIPRPLPRAIASFDRPQCPSRGRAQVAGKLVSRPQG